MNSLPLNYLVMTKCFPLPTFVICEVTHMNFATLLFDAFVILCALTNSLLCFTVSVPRMSLAEWDNDQLRSTLHSAMRSRRSKSTIHLSLLLKVNLFCPSVDYIKTFWAAYDFERMKVETSMGRSGCSLNIFDGCRFSMISVYLPHSKLNKPWLRLTILRAALINSLLSGSEWRIREVFLTRAAVTRF